MDIIETIKNAGIVGAGGAGFPTHIKISAKAEVFIVNAAECEPLIETDKYIMREYATEIVTAIMAVGETLCAKRKVFATKAKYKKEIAAICNAVKQLNADIEMFEMDAFYPAGDEQTIVALVTGKSVPERGLPLDVGAVVSNVGTLLNISQALKNASPVTQKLLSVVGEVKKPIMLKVPIGTKITQCVEAAVPNFSDYSVILGGPMMGQVVADSQKIEAAVVTKTTGNIIVLKKDHYLIRRATTGMDKLKLQTHAACIQCRMCTDLCPRYLLGHQIRPHIVMRNLSRVKNDLSEEQFLSAFGDAANCCSCGACELFSCPMGLSPRRVNDYVKGVIREKGVNVPKNTQPCMRKELTMRQIPTGRLVARLGLSKYYSEHVEGESITQLSPNSVYIPLKQHIGKAAVPNVSVGSTVKTGDLIGKAAEGLSANIHASIAGTVEKIDEMGVTIARTKEA